MGKRNDVIFTAETHLRNFKTAISEFSDEAKNDLILGSIAIKYTQSNSVGYSKGGMMIGVGAGQQSRVDCVKLAGRKASTWRLRFHPKVMALPFKEGTKRQDRVNARVRYIEGDFQDAERVQWEQLFSSTPAMLTPEEKAEFLGGLTGVALASDAFFPFRDSIDYAARLGVKYVAQAGGSVADDEVIAACDAYGGHDLHQPAVVPPLSQAGGGASQKPLRGLPTVFVSLSFDRAGVRVPHRPQRGLVCSVFLGVCGGTCVPRAKGMHTFSYTGHVCQEF